MFLPQQLPGPAQLDAWPGDDPQQAVSAGPGMLFLTGPDTEECAETSFSMLWLLQKLQAGSSLDPTIKISLTFPHSLHLYSKMGMFFPLQYLKSSLSSRSASSKKVSQRPDVAKHMPKKKPPRILAVFASIQGCYIISIDCGGKANGD